MAIELPLQLNFIAFAIPGAVAALAMTVFALNERRTRIPLPAAQAL
jgi:AAHS family benzoate transporter-like MFS transporter